MEQPLPTGAVGVGASPRVQRRLAALLSADVHGYSRLMGRDEAETVRDLEASRRIFAANVEGRGGRVVDAPGDNVLAEFTSVVSAVEAASAIQEALEERQLDRAEDERMRFRIGVHLGDVIVEDGRLYGDGVNVTARLEALALPGGICVSEDVRRQVEGKLPFDFEDLGERELKNIDRPTRAYRLRARERSRAGEPQQEIRFCTAADGARIAYAIAGSGPPLVKAANWLNHLEHDWVSPAWRHLLRDLTREHTLVRYDERGTGLSDRDVPTITFDDFVTDLETVVNAVGLERFPLLGISQGCAVSIAYAVRHPERVTHLVLFGGYARGTCRRGSPGAEQEAVALRTLIREGWGKANPALRQFWTTVFMPDATPEQARWFNELQRVSASPEGAARIRETLDHIDVEALLPQVRTPTLVLHCRDDEAVPFDEGRRVAAGIPGARFVALQGRNHMILEDEPSWPRFLEEVRAFLRS